MDVVEAYALDVVAGRVPAGKYHRLSCQRHLNDLARQGTEAFPYRFDYLRADRFFRVAEKLKHYKGEWAGQPIELQPYQKFRWGVFFGWFHQGTGLRRFRHAFNLLPRKQGKSLEAAVVGLYVTFFDSEPGAEGYCAATKEAQAKIVWGDCKKLVTSSGLKQVITPLAKNLHREAFSQKLEPIGSDSDSTDGLNPHFVNIDEYQAHRTRGLIDVLETATGARRQPVINKIGTAGDDIISPCGDEYDYACKLLEGTLVNESYFAFIAHADTGDDWTQESTWRKANPNFGVSVKADDMRDLVTKALGIPSAAATFKQKRLNLWGNRLEPCLSVDGWRKGQSDWDPAELAGEPCWVGIDLAKKVDLCSMTLVFPPRPGRPQTRWLQRIWTPADTIADRAHRDRAPYQVWVDQGWIVARPGVRVDTHTVVKQALLEAREVYDIEGIGADPWHLDTLFDELEAEGFAPEQLIEIPQTYNGMSSACLRLQADVLAGEIDARRCPVTTWCVSNVVANQDGKENLMFAKGKSRGRIDPVISGAIGTALWLRQPGDTEPKYDMFFLGGGR
jgi:phage terminase large subunit-like protein